MLDIFKSIIGVFINEKSLQGIYNLYTGVPVRYRDTVKLKHVATELSLHSHDTKYAHTGSSGQQQVTAYHGSDSNDYWIIKGPNGQPENYKEGQPISDGDVIRLEHLNTKRNLHSHGGIRSPLSNQQEVTAYGDSGIGDFNDNWRIEIEHGTIRPIWQKKAKIRFIHVDTNHALHSHHGHSSYEYTADQQEVTCFPGRDDNDWWIISK